MSEFTFLFRGRDFSMSPEQRQKHTEKWVAWFKELGAKGHIKDMGRPLEAAGKVVKGASRNVHDGPYAEAKDLVGGYTLIEAASLNEAVELSKACPIFEVGGAVEVRPVQALDVQYQNM
ncbi:MAG TPA: YciI family protein [Roseiarcus sp.]|nr:YciI family protein [Roseiarcus sp.]